MRDRTASRSYSPAHDEFRRVHERHRAWGLAQRHAEKLRRLRAGSSGSRPSASEADHRVGAVRPSAPGQPPKIGYPELVQARPAEPRLPHGAEAQPAKPDAATQQPSKSRRSPVHGRSEPPPQAEQQSGQTPYERRAVISPDGIGRADQVGGRGRDPRPAVRPRGVTTSRQSPGHDLPTSRIFPARTDCQPSTAGGWNQASPRTRHRRQPTPCRHPKAQLGNPRPPSRHRRQPPTGTVAGLPTMLGRSTTATDRQTRRRYGLPRPRRPKRQQPDRPGAMQKSIDQTERKTAARSFIPRQNHASAYATVLRP